MKSRTEHYYYIQKTTIVLTQLRIVNIASTLKAINVHSRLVHDLKTNDKQKNNTETQKFKQQSALKKKYTSDHFTSLKLFPVQELFSLLIQFTMSWLDSDAIVTATAS